jgi:nucleoside-diphosphate-sugar epimerase
MKKILILGVNGFIGHHLTKRILETTDWEVYGMDMSSDKLGDMVNDPRVHFVEGDITINKEWVEYHVKKCDTILPLVAVATPATYVQNPLRVFELDFEANLPIIKDAVKYKKHLIWPSTSEVYGMSKDTPFDPYESELTYGPINKQRWIYACAKQMMDRVIAAYGQEQGFNYTLFRPFNWVGPGLDKISNQKEGSPRVITQFMSNIVFGRNLELVDGGEQRRCFTYIDDGISALMKIIENKDGIATGKIYNIGNPAEDHSIGVLAVKMLETAKKFSAYPKANEISITNKASDEFYGKGYQDVQSRVPKITNTQTELGWNPTVTLDEALYKIFEFYQGHALDLQDLTE